ncbi:hypothetical protein A1O3_09091 [Capronia epimyces CBS 606.96]|uniref:VWFA domain-containing protein n=1 Tax=Capronia epimyces CBS 606.96 TaxID=1182542 RepID=W9XBT7_9EURO|nr:uncharacterized protein A1O3_09091 [Capronia epimyces CBS 606.96]EXJ77932.1 hypothetical protein A1O3_09091 [Capronia epimyces CBS 606.96]
MGSATTLIDQSAEDFIMVDDGRDLPIRPRSTAPEDSPAVEVQPLVADDAFLVSVRTPKLPKGGLQRASCDIVLVIDVSASMDAAAPLPEAENGADKEATGLSVLDLTKHAARTVLETLGEDDRLGIVTFSNDAKVVQNLVRMTPDEKSATWKRIDRLQTKSSTNLWAGIRRGWEVFEQARPAGNVQGLFVLTDGQPNHMCPPQGYVAKLGPILTMAAPKRRGIPTIHTFGFGYHIRSELMQSIAEVGHGNYSFIPDAGMIGTVFVHSVANLFTTLGTSATLELTVTAAKMTRLQATGGLPVETGRNGITLTLGSIQYGQSRDLVVECPGIAKDAVIHAHLRYKLPGGQVQDRQSRASFADKTTLDAAVVDYHKSRAQVCAFLSSLFPIKDNGEHGPVLNYDQVALARTRLDALVASIETLPTKDDPAVQSLLADLAGDDPAGQVAKALLWTHEQGYWMKWGRHYLPSLLHAHQRQMCNTFKDPGPLRYGQDSPLFVHCRTELDTAFDNLPAPKPSLPEKVVPVYSATGQVTGTTTRAYQSVRMSSYNSRSAPCFEGNSRIATADGAAIPIKTLTVGTSVWTPMGAREVAAVVKTRVRRHDEVQLCRVGELWVTPWHPLQHEGRWVFPMEIADDTTAFEGDVYSVLLTPSRHVAAHAVEVSGQVCVTLGHGLLRRRGDVRSHPFLGHYQRVAASLSRLPTDKHGHVESGGLQRNGVTGLACGFMAPQETESMLGGPTMKAVL